MSQAPARGLPASEHLEWLLAFARQPPRTATYEVTATSLGLRIVRNDYDPEYRMFRARGFGLMLIDGFLARLHGAGLFDPSEKSEQDSDLGVAVVTSHADLLAAFRELHTALCGHLGAPTKEGTWRQVSLLDEAEHEFGYACWAFDESVLVLLLDNDGDAHIGEFGTVDLRIAPIDALAELPASVQETFGWPIEY